MLLGYRLGAGLLVCLPGCVLRGAAGLVFGVWRVPGL